MNMVLFKKWRIDRNSPCPCRSGKKYKKCCELFLRTDLKNQAHNLYEQKNFEKAEIAFRAHLTQYIIWYHEHTKPFISNRTDKTDELVVVDIGAITYLLNSIVRCLFYQGKAEKIDDFLQRASDIIDDFRYKFYLATMRALWFAILNHFEKAREVLKAVSFVDVSKIETKGDGKSALKIFLDILRIELPISQALQIVDRLLQVVDDPIEKVELLTQKAWTHFIHLDSQTANSVIDNALLNIVEIKTNNENEHVRSLFATADAYDFKSVISEDKKSATKAINIYKAIHPFISDDPLSVRWLNSRIGHLYDFLQDYTNARKYFAASCEIQPSVQLLIDLAKTSVLLGEVETAFKFLSRIDADDAEKNKILGYLEVQAEIAIIKNDHLLAKNLDSYLLGLELSTPIERELRDKIRVKLLQMLANKTDKNTSSTSFQKLRSVISRYLILQPTIFGIGINFNEIFKPREKNKD